MRLPTVISITILFIVFTSANLIAADGDGSLTDTNIQYIGRWDKSNKKEYHSYWGGAYFKVSFTGTTIKIKLSSAVDIYVNIDGKGDVRYKQLKGIVNLSPDALPNKTHTLIVAANYAGDEIKFEGLILDDGAKTLPQPKKEIIEFIGNSITTGQKTTKGDLSAYAWLTGEYLSTDHTQISQPGITLVDGYRYDANWAPNRGQSVQYFLMKQPNHDVNPTWDFKSYNPKIVVINLGTNDYNLKVPKEVFQTTYRKFLKEIRSKFPKAEIFAMRIFAGYYAEETKKVADQLINAGDAKIHYIDTNGWLSKPDDYIDGTHPNDAAHIKAAEKLSSILKNYLSGA